MANVDTPQRTRLRDKILTGAQKYKNKLLNKDFLVICENGESYNVRFFAKDFQHLTGVLSDLTETEFFSRCCDNTLTVNNIKERQKYNLNTLRDKTKRIEKIDEIIYGNSEDSLFMVNLHTNTADYPVAIRNKNIETCIGFCDDIHRARTLRKYANSANADKQLAIIAIFGKPTTGNNYTELSYLKDRDILLENNPEILESLSDDIRIDICPTEEMLAEVAATVESRAESVDNNRDETKDGSDSSVK